MDDTETIWVLEDWACLERIVGEAAEDDKEWDLLSGWLHSGMAAILVNGLPRVIYGTIH
jgi:hypothetical protein